jgi:hypothetical protein
MLSRVLLEQPPEETKGGTLTVLTYYDATDDQGAEAAPLVQTGARHGITPRLVQPLRTRACLALPKHVRKLHVLREHLAADHVKEAIVVLTDMADVLVNASADELTKRFQATGADVVVSADSMYVYQEEALRGVFDRAAEVDCGQSKRYCNGGLMMGRQQALLELLDACIVAYAQGLWRTPDQPYTEQAVLGGVCATALAAGDKARWCIHIDRDQALFYNMCPAEDHSLIVAHVAGLPAHVRVSAAGKLTIGGPSKVACEPCLVHFPFLRGYQRQGLRSHDTFQYALAALVAVAPTADTID